MNLPSSFRGIATLALVVTVSLHCGSAAADPADSTAARAADSTAHAMHGHHDMGGMDMSGDMAGMDMSGEHEHSSMTGMYGPYPMTREASGTSWQPDAAEHTGLHVMRGDWMFMLHGGANLAYDHQGGPRGDHKLFSDNMVMGMAQRTRGRATLGFRTMLSAEPATIGKSGYPLLLQTGETADGVTPLIDRQHPHDLFMELATSLSVASGKNAVFLYAGLPGEPALGPPAFMHRFSGSSMPVAPITHHWLDSTHITYGVLTAGAVIDRIKVEASAFRGREPDENRWNIETPTRLDSHAFRVSMNPVPAWSFQISHGRITSPEQLEPEVDQDRTTASAMYDGRWSGGHWEGLAAWGRNRNRPGRMLDAFLLEAAMGLGERHTLFMRAEQAEKDELFRGPDPLAGRAFDVGEISAGYRCALLRSTHAELGLGVTGTWSNVPAALRDAYGDHPAAFVATLAARLR